MFCFKSCLSALSTEGDEETRPFVLFGWASPRRTWSLSPPPTTVCCERVRDSLAPSSGFLSGLWQRALNPTLSCSQTEVLWVISFTIIVPRKKINYKFKKNTELWSRRSSFAYGKVVLVLCIYLLKKSKMKQLMANSTMIHLNALFT